MREIKFRVYDTKDKKMISHFNGARIDYALTYWETHKHVSDPMQFTGLLDRQGVEIYEGDIVKYGVFALNDRRNFGKTPWENLPDGVKEDDITFTINTFIVEHDIQFLEKLRVAITANPDVQGVEVIGNIHENPELVGE